MNESHILCFLVEPLKPYLVFNTRKNRVHLIGLQQQIYDFWRLIMIIVTNYVPADEIHVHASHVNHFICSLMKWKTTVCILPTQDE